MVKIYPLNASKGFSELSSVSRYLTFARKRAT